MKPNKITLTYLRKLGACNEAVEEFNSRKIQNTRAILQALVKEKKWDWFNWISTRLMTHKQKIKWAIFCAEQVINIYEKKYPGDDRPRKAIKAAKACLNKSSEKTRAAANAAANAASYAAAYAANAASYAAAYAANAAAAAAAYAANAANAAAKAAANAAYAAYAAAGEKMRITCAKKALAILR